MKVSQQGSSILMVLFVFIVLGMLGAAMIRILNVGAESAVREVLSSRALFAANSAVERQLGEILPPGGAANPSACVARSYAFAALSDYGCGNVVTDCAVTTVDGVNYFLLRSTGRCGPANEQAVRTVVVQAKDQ